MSWIQREIRLNPRGRGIKKYKRFNKRACPKLFFYVGCHLVHREIVNQVPELNSFKIGMANVFCKQRKRKLVL